MAYNYDKLYSETPDALGKPTQVFVDFFDQYEREDARILDVGCGQGRDALFMAEHGHRVVGVDISPHGIQDLIAAAKRANVSVEGVVADIAAYKPEGMFDVILVDRTLHMLSEKTRLSVLEQLLGHVDVGGWVLIADEATNISGFEEVISSHRFDWQHEFSKRGYLFVSRS
jgi:SAM-dependent methyltransferase